MKRILAIVAGAAVVIALAVGVFLLADGDGPSAATIGDTTISQQYVDDELDVLINSDVLDQAIKAQAEQSQQAPQVISNVPTTATTEIAAGWLSLIVAQEFAAREVEARGVDITAADREAGSELASQSVGGTKVYDSLPTWFRDRLDDRWTPVAALQAAAAADPSPELQQLLDASCPSGRYVSHILVATEAEAAALRQELDAGADFEDLAVEHSTDTGSAQQGGQLGCLDGQSFVEPFAGTAASLTPGTVSEPVMTEFGAHLITVSDDPPEALLAQAAFEAVLGSGRGEDVEIDDRYGTWDARNGQVLPPKLPVTTAPPTG